MPFRLRSDYNKYMREYMRQWMRDKRAMLRLIQQVADADTAKRWSRLVKRLDPDVAKEDPDQHYQTFVKPRVGGRPRLSAGGYSSGDQRRDDIGCKRLAVPLDYSMYQL